MRLRKDLLTLQEHQRLSWPVCRAEVVIVCFNARNFGSQEKYFDPLRSSWLIWARGGGYIDKTFRDVIEVSLTLFLYCPIEGSLNIYMREKATIPLTGFLACWAGIPLYQGYPSIGKELLVVEASLTRIIASWVCNGLDDRMVTCLPILGYIALERVLCGLYSNGNTHRKLTHEYILKEGWTLAVS